MQRVPFVKMEEAPQEVHSLFDKMESRGAQVLNLHRVLAHSPAAALNYIRLGNSLLERSKLDRKLRELAVLRVSYLAGCDYEWAHHLPIALRLGVSREQAASIARWQEASVFDGMEQAVLRYTDEVALKVQVAPETFAALRRYLDEVSIVELSLSIAYWGMTARLLVAMQIDLEDKYKGHQPFQVL